MTVTLAAITVDCDDAHALARFWSTALDRPLADEPAPSREFALIGRGDHGAGLTPSWMFTRVPEGKTAKNRFATRGLWAAIREMKTCGIVAEDAAKGLLEVADPFGVVAAVIPTTNPTSTALFKSIICLKSRNGMVASPGVKKRRDTVQP